MPQMTPALFDELIRSVILPGKRSHKGLNGRLLIIGGSSLFHAASLWAASVACRMVDMVHYASTQENEEVFINLKTKFVDGIILPRKDLLSYVEEDDCILLGPGMLRGEIADATKENAHMSFEEILALTAESDFTYAMTRYLLKNFPHKRFVLDAGALQMMELEWLQHMQEKPILTPHSREFQQLFGHSALGESPEQLAQNIRTLAKKHNCVIMMKYVEDHISDGNQYAVVEGGNEGLAKGGSGDVLAGLTSALYTHNDSFASCVLSSFILKSAAEELYKIVGPFFSTSDLIVQIGKSAKKLLFDF